jgi:hypothetical protein
VPKSVLASRQCKLRALCVSSTSGKVPLKMDQSDAQIDTECQKQLVKTPHSIHNNTFKRQNNLTETQHKQLRNKPARDPGLPGTGCTKTQTLFIDLCQPYPTPTMQILQTTPLQYGTVQYSGQACAHPQGGWPLPCIQQLQDREPAASAPNSVGSQRPHQHVCLLKA